MKPREYQDIALQLLSARRKEGENKALVVMASSLGKTIVAALDVKNFLAEQQGKREKSSSRVLCLCHSNAVLEQNMAKFKQILGNTYSYGMFNGYKKNTTADIIFASFASMQMHTDLFRKDDFGYVVVDEAHHAPARTHRRAIAHFRPKFLLGLTATPDRMDGQRLEDIFGSVIYDLGFFEAMRRNLLVKVDYRVLLDELVDLDFVSVGEERLSIRELNRRLFVPKRDQEIVRLIEEKVKANQCNSIIVFCRSIEHAERINALLPGSRLLHSHMSKALWRQNLSDFQHKEVKYIVSVDQLNEGVDIPGADAIVFLRSTVSQIVYYQQLGRGLRIHKGKKKVIVLDFVASYERLKTIATLQKDIKTTSSNRLRHFNLSIEADKFTEQKMDIFSILATIEKLIGNRRYSDETLINQVKMMSEELGKVPTCKEFSQDPRVASIDTIMERFGSWNNLLEAAGLEIQWKRGYTKEELLAQVRMLAKELGRAPSSTEFERDSRVASVATARVRFGSWYDFLRTAGLEVQYGRRYTEKELITQVRMLAKKLGRTPSSDEFKQTPGVASMSAIIKNFGTWNEFLKVAGLEHQWQRRYTKEELITQVKMMAEELGRTPTGDEFKRPLGTASSTVICKYFGTWNRFLEAAGLKLNQKKGQTEEDLIAQVKMLAEELGRTPTSKEFTRDSRTASLDTVTVHFGLWNNLLEAAGLEIRWKRSYTKEELIAQAKMLAEELGRPPTRAEFVKDPRVVCITTIMKCFGSWDKFLEIAGLEVQRKKEYTEDELIAQVKMLAEELGKPPTRAEFVKDPRVATNSIVLKLFGTWGNLLRAAGLKR